MDKETYHAERKLLIDAEREGARSFDKAMLTLSAGALALSITFVRHVAPQPRLVWVLVVSWVAFICSLLSILLSFLLSEAGMRKQRKIIDADLMRQSKACSEPNWFFKAVVGTNWASMVLFVGGVILFAVFAGCNLPSKEKLMSDKGVNQPAKDGQSSIEKGFPPPEAPAQQPPSEEQQPSAPPESTPQTEVPEPGRIVEGGYVPPEPPVSPPEPPPKPKE